MRQFMLMAGVILGLFTGGCGDEPRSDRRLSEDEITAIAKATAEVIRVEYTLSCGMVSSRVGEQRCDFLRKSDLEAPPVASEPPAAVSSAPDAAHESDAVPIPDVGVPDAVPLPDARPAPASPPPAASQPARPDAAMPMVPKPAVEVLGSVYSDTGKGATISVVLNDRKLPRVLGDIGWGAYRTDKFLGYVRVNKTSDLGFDGWINGSKDDLKAEGLVVKREAEPKYNDKVNSGLIRIISGEESLPPHTITLKVSAGQVRVGQTGFAYRDGVRKGAFRVYMVGKRSVQVHLFYVQLGAIHKDKMSFRFVPSADKQLDLPPSPGALVTPQAGEILVRIFRVMLTDSGATITAQLPDKTDLVKSGEMWKIRGALGEGKFDERGEGKVGKVADKSFTLDFVGATDKLVGDMVAVYTPSPPPPPPVAATNFQFPLFWIEPIEGDGEHVRLLAICSSGGCPKEIKSGALGKIFEGDKDLGIVMFKEHQLSDRLAFIGPQSLLAFKAKATSLVFKIDTTEAAQTLLLAEASKAQSKRPPPAKPMAAKPATPKPAPKPPAQPWVTVKGAALLRAQGTKLTRATLSVVAGQPLPKEGVQVSYTVGGAPGKHPIRFIKALNPHELLFRLDAPFSEFNGKVVAITLRYRK